MLTSCKYGSLGLVYFYDCFVFLKTTICRKFYPKVGVTISDFDFFIVNVKLVLKSGRLSTFLLEDYNFCFRDVYIHHPVVTEFGNCAQCFL